MRDKLGPILVTSVIAFALLVGTPGDAPGQQLVYQPRVPAFGGGAASFQVLMQAAEAQRPEQSQGVVNDPLANFEQNLQRQLLGQLSRRIVQSQFPDDVNLQEEGQFQLGDFLVNVMPGPPLQIRIANTVTGDETVVTVPSF